MGSYVLLINIFSYFINEYGKINQQLMQNLFTTFINKIIGTLSNHILLYQ